MPTYLGFSTHKSCQPRTTNALNGNAGGPGGTRQSINFGNKFRLVDVELVIQDLMNAFSIRRGTKVGQPGYGSRIWDFVFEFNGAGTQFQIENEVRRIANSDPRIALSQVKAYPYNNGILIEVQLAILPYNQPVAAKISFNTQTRKATATIL